MSDEPDLQVGAEHYDSRAYNTKERFCSFWHQLDEALALGAGTVLEVGPGSGLVTGWLRRSGVQVTTLDVDPALGPDIVGSVTDLPPETPIVDVVVCCEVLEHLPFEQSQRALAELRRVARRAVVVSLPDDRPWVGVAYPLIFGTYVSDLRQRWPGRFRPVLAALRRELRLRDAVFLALVPPAWSFGGPVAALRRPPIPHRPWQHDFDGHHYWEIGVEGYPLERVTAAFEAAGFELEREFRVPENPWHHFFVLRPAGEPA